MPRLFVPADCVEGTTVRLSGQQARRAFHVLRLREGDPVRILDGEGMEHEARVCLSSSHEVAAEIMSSRRCGSEPVTRVTLLQAIPKGTRMDLVVEKCTEIGVHRIVPIITDRTVVRPDRQSAESRQRRWREIARQATEQCGRNTVPDVAAPARFPEALSRLGNQDACVVLSECGAVASLAKALGEVSPSSSVALLVGPEGGFTEDERQCAVGHSFVPVGLGSRILRSETAGIVAVALTLWLTGNLQPIER